MPLDLKSRNSLLRRGTSPERIGPVLHWQPGLLIYRPDPYGVLLFAIPATPQEPLAALSGFGVFHLVHVHRTALHAARCIAPTLEFKELNSRNFVTARQRNVLDDRRFREIMSLLIHN